MKKTATRRVEASKYKRKGIKFGNKPWIYKQINKYSYNWIIHHPQGVQSPIFNDCQKVNIDGHTEPQLVPKLLLQVSVIELHKKLVSNADNVGLKEARDENDNIIISDFTLRSLLPTQLKIKSSKYKVMCSC